MTAWRLLAACLLVGVIGVPLVLPLLESVTFSLSDLDIDVGYLGHVATNTLLLIAGTLALSLPLGTLGAVLLFRTDLPWRRFWIGAAVVSLFVPLPVLLSAWTALLGQGGLLPWPGWEINLSRAWFTGLWPATWVHSLAGIPWVALIVGSGLCWVERELEEEALLHVGPWRVLCKVTLPRCRASLAVAAGWLALATFGEITVTYFLQVTTFAEEIQTQFAGSSRLALARSVLLSLPVIGALAASLLLLVPRLEKPLPPLQGGLGLPRSFTLGRGRWPWALAIATFATGLLLLPVVALIWKVGLAGTPRTWSLAEVGANLWAEGRVASGNIVETSLTAIVTACCAACLGLLCCWLGRDGRWFRTLLLVLMALAWSLPGPVIGIGLKQAIDFLRFEPFEFLLYQGPSPAPAMWAHVVRFFPVAVALFWPQVRRVPRELLEHARLEGASPVRELTQVIWPHVSRTFRWTVLVLTALCLGEVAASNRVETPGWETFAKLVLDRMHYGVDSTVAAMCLLQIAFLATCVAAIWFLKLSFLAGKVAGRRAARQLS